MEDGLGLTQGRTQVMTRETKIGLLLGMGVILLIGIIISDQLSQEQQGQAADFTGFGGEAQRTIDNSDATPSPGYAPGYAPGRAPGYTPGYPPAYAPAGTPADNSTVTDVPDGFFIPPDVQATLPQRQAEATVDTPDNRPLPAYNVSQDPDRQANRTDDGVPTMTIGDSTPELPHYAQPIPAASNRVDTPRITPASSGTPVIRHTVLQGESMIQIARRYYGNGDYWKAIALANPGKVSRDGGVNIGMVLDIPKRDDAVLGLDIESIGRETTRPADIRTAATRSKTIEIQPGDTLSELASKHLGSAARWEDLLEANKDQLDGPQSLRVGMKLRIPGTTGRVQAPAAANNSSTSQTRSGKTYTVKPGDNLTEIAEKMLGDGDKWKMVYEANRDKLKSPDRLIVGQKLRIPS
jgi:nucleoid-associated protein YgaU